MINEPVILFDGICNYCNSMVNFVIKRDKKASLKFTPLQSNVAQQLLAGNHFLITDLSSFVFIEKDIIFTSSTAALRVCKYLNGLWPLMYGFIIVPKFIRDGIYNLISKNRYKWFGKKEKCMIPSPEIKERFLNEFV